MFMQMLYSGMMPDTSTIGQADAATYSVESREQNGTFLYKYIGELPFCSASGDSEDASPDVQPIQVTGQSSIPSCGACRSGEVI